MYFIMVHRTGFLTKSLPFPGLGLARMNQQRPGTLTGRTVRRRRRVPRRHPRRCWSRGRRRGSGRWPSAHPMCSTPPSCWGWAAARPPPRCPGRLCRCRRRAAGARLASPAPAAPRPGAASWGPPAARASRSRRCSSARCSRGAGATAASPRPWFCGSACWPGWWGCASPRSSSRPACSAPATRRRKERGPAGQPLQTLYRLAFLPCQPIPSQGEPRVLSQNPQLQSRTTCLKFLRWRKSWLPKTENISPQAKCIEPAKRLWGKHNLHFNHSFYWQLHPCFSNITSAI